ncbi:MAG: LacI family DNA-binding transcriptional regulator [Devosia sp.]|nr:LacI family DNA-binding transcriptional regulator [Devosia sp.]
MEDVARLAGVSPITVSRALSYPEKVREETRLKVADAVAKTGYVVNHFASSLRSGRSSIVTVFVSSLLNPHFADSMQGLIDAFEGSPFHLMFAQTSYSEQFDMDAVGAVLPFRPAGLVFTGVVRSEATRRALGRLGVPVLEMWGARPDPIDMLIGFSNHDAGELMGRHLGACGFRHVAYSGHTVERGAERLEGLRTGLAAFGASIELAYAMEGTRQMSDGMAAFDAILEQLPACDAIFFGTDVLAFGALVRAYDRGIPVPGRVAIAGLGNLEFSQHTRPSLTTLHVGGYEVGREAGRRMLRRLNGAPVDDPIVSHPITLEARGSTRH